MNPLPRFAGASAGHNPFFLASALSMLVGYFVLADAIPESDGRLTNLLYMVGALELYELMLLGLGLFLFLKRGLRRDGTTLVVLALLFVADITFLNVEAWTADPVSALPVHAVVFALGIVKILVVVRLLAPGFRMLRVVQLLVEYATLLFLPGLLVQLNADQPVSGGTLLGCWWILGALLASKGVVYVASARRDIMENVASERETGLHLALSWIVIGALGLHLVAASYIFDAAFHLSFVSPVLLGSAVYGTLAWPTIPSPYCEVRKFTFVAPVIAVALSAFYSPSLEVTLGTSELILSPLRLSLFGTAVVYSVSFAAFRLKSMLAAAGGTAFLGLAGHSVEAIFETLEFLLPRTKMHWGIASVAAAFVLLAFGAMKSLRGPGSRSTSAECSPGTAPVARSEGERIDSSVESVPAPLSGSDVESEVGSDAEVSDEARAP